MSAEKKKKTAESKSSPTYRLPREGGWASAWKLSAALGGLGVVGCLIGWSSDPHRFAFSWLFGVMSFLAIGLGALFFVLWQHLAGAGWSISIRRIPELLMSGLPVLALLVVPILFQMDELYPWMESWRESQAHGQEESHDAHASGEHLVGASVARAQDHGSAEAHGEGHDAHHTPQHAAHEEVIRSKLAYLNQPSFLIRAVVYCAIWIVLAWFFFTSSTKQDTTRDLSLTRRMQSLSPIATFSFALTLTFAAFDWMMSLEPTWFSTIFGVQYFAVSAVSSLAMIVLMLFGLKSAGVFGEAVTTEHFHDLGKLLFGFLVFWAYISFSQFMLIWYASIPEETTYYHLRWAGGWRTFSLFMVVAHFVVPFLLLMSRNVKRRLPVLAFGAAWLLVMHVTEVFWLVMPYVSPGELTVHWIDLAALFAVGGVYLTFVFFMMGRYPLVPVGDPRLTRAIHLEVH
jgi:F0F1-type ATP synthase assembly protein I